ncbi:MAG: AraC family transcriptional regulator [Saprospiraceae bacterium]|nr:AraC family transcriptional regulator [Saprospiraceae bacterium]
MKLFRFDHNKFDHPLKMEIGLIHETPQFFLSEDIHATDFFEIMIFEEAAGYIQLDSQRVDVEPGTFLFITPMQKRSWRLANLSVKGWFLIFEKDFLAEFFSDDLFVYRLQFFYNQQVVPAFRPSDQGDILPFDSAIFREMLDEINHYKQDSPHLLRALLYYLLIKMNRAFCRHHALESNTQLNTQAYAFKALLEQEIRRHQQVQEYASMLQLSRVSLNKISKGQFGLSASEMIKERLVQEIKKDLLFGNQNVSEIAFELGFSESNNLIRFFKKRVGISPKQYRIRQGRLSN